MVFAEGQLTLNDVVKINEARLKLYLFLSRAFSREVDRDFLQSILDIQPALEYFAAHFEVDEIRHGSCLLKDFAFKVKHSTDGKIISDLASAYAKLFLGVGSKIVYLCESAYANNKEHLLYRQPYFEVVKEYQALGFEKRVDFREPEDHISVETDFMVNLCQLTISSLKEADIKTALKYLNHQKDFLEGLLVRWVPLLSRSLMKASNSEFYTAIAYLLLGFIKIDVKLVDLLIDEVKNSAKKPLDFPNF